MRDSKRVSYSWDGAAAQLDRLAKANASADESWLRSLTVDESVRIFEDLSHGIPELDVSAAQDPPPVVLFRLWST